ncbi:myosin-2 heavy chain isoform X2 [Nilaparvata lugens]|uniref:myosin-2 heavy chain isoform X2 n=1 Tax=Nilaparvata lugens TaxID=108931 RepID=UPI00193CC575|nr:myosin-2 heavy chain isoform X2 [Nilaparvata lugens]
MTLKIPSIHGQILDSSTRQSSNALDVDHCLQEALGSQSESVTSDESDSKNDNLSNSSGVKSQKPNVVQGIGSENIDNNRLNESSLCKASLNTDRTSPSSRKCVEDSKNKRNHSLSLSLREAKVVNTEIDSDNFIPPSPVKPLKRSINVEKVSKDVDSEKNKEGTNFSNDEFEKTEEEKSAFNVSTSKITFRTRKNNLWNNDETFGNVSSFLKNLDSPQSCLRRSESPSSSNNSPATSDKHNRSVRFSSHDSVLRFDANTKGLSNHTSVRNSITQEESKSRNSSGSPKKMEVPEKKLSETIKSPPRSASPKKVLKSNITSNEKLGEINKPSSEHRKSSLTQTIVSKSSESRNSGKNADSESSSDDSLVGMSENRKSPLTQTILSKSSGNVSRNSESNSSSKDGLVGLPEKRKSSLTQTILSKSSESRTIGRESDSELSSDDSLVGMSENRKSPLTQKVSKSSEKSVNAGRNSESESSSEDSLVGMSENRKSPLTQTIVSKSSKKSVNVDRKPESDSSSDESLEENEGVSQTRFMDSSMTVGESFKHTGVSTDFDSTFYEKLEKEGKRKERPSDETNSSDTPENLDSDEKIERINNKSPKNVKSPVKDVKTPKTSLTPRRDSVNSIPALKVDESFEKRRKMFLENTKSPEKRRDVSIVTETPEKLDSNEKLGRLESVGGLNTSKNDVATASSDHGKSKRKSNEKERQKLMTDDSEKGEAQNMLPDETDSRIRTIIDERSNASTKFTSNLSSIKSRHSVPGFNLDDETPKRTRRDSEKHDDDDRRRVSGSRIMEVQSANIVSVHKAHDSLERNSMSKEGNQVDCGRKDSIKVSDGVNVRVGSPEKAIRERAASICEESTATMLLKDAFSKFWGSKNRKSSGAKVVDSVDASTVEDSNQDTDLDQTSKKSGKVKRKSIEAIVKPAENLVKDDFGKETDMKKNIENSTRKSLEKKRKSLDGNVKSAENEAKTVNVKTSSEDENLDELIRKIEDAKRKSLDRNVSTVEERVPENASTLKDTNQNADSDRIAIKMKKKKSKEREFDKRKSIEEEVGIEENLKQENRDCSLINSYQDTDVERLSKMGKKKKKHKDRDFEDRESEDILLNENMNLSLQNSKEEVDLEKVSKKPKKKKELDVGKAEELCATEECVEQEIVNRDSSVQDSNQERDMIKRVKKKKKHKENEKTERVLEPFTTENVEVKQEFKNNDLPVIDIVSSEMNLEKLSEKMKKKTKKLKQEREDEGENQEDIRTKWLAVDSNQCPVVEKLSKSKKKSRKKQKELEDLNKSSILLDSNNESGVQEMPKKIRRRIRRNLKRWNLISQRRKVKRK